jgi:hypothetical protein
VSPGLTALRQLGLYPVLTVQPLLDGLTNQSIQLKEGESGSGVHVRIEE